MRKLIVNADDLGYSVNRNRGIIESVESGIVTSVSILVNFPATGEAIEFAKVDTQRRGAVALETRLPASGEGADDPCGRIQTPNLVIGLVGEEHSIRCVDGQSEDVAEMRDRSRLAVRRMRGDTYCA